MTNKPGDQPAFPTGREFEELWAATKKRLELLIDNEEQLNWLIEDVTNMRGLNFLMDRIELLLSQLRFKTDNGKALAGAIKHLERQLKAALAQSEKGEK